MGCGPRRVTFALLGEMDLLTGGEEVPALDATLDELLERILPSGPGRFTLDELLAHAGQADSAALARALWDLAWAGRLTNTTMAALRQGIASGFGASAPPGPSRPPHSSGLPGSVPRPQSLRPVPRASRRATARSASGPAHFDRWRASRPFGGAWMRLPRPDPPADALGTEELNRDRARVLLDRYGLLFRELLARELPGLQWPALLKTLRIMELGGEVIGGCFFAGIPGLQFIAPAALGQLQAGLPADRVFWMNAADPASPCGLDLPGWDYPRRTSSTHLVFDGPALVVVSHRRGRQLEVSVAPEHPRLDAYLAFLEHLLARAVRPRRGVVIEEINGHPAVEGGYREVLARRFEVTRDHRALRIGRKYLTGRSSDGHAPPR
jgi:ATP-dependent Lhr-like helicase